MRMHDLKIEMEAGEIWGRRHGVPPEQRFYGPGGDTGASVQSAGGNYTALLDALIQGLPQTLSAEQTYGPGFTEAGLVNTGTELKGTATTPGYLSLYQNNVAPVLNATTATANTSARTANLADLTKLGGGAADAIAGIDPATAALSKSLTGTAQSQLNAGTAIDPFTMDNTINSVLGAYSNRGLGTSPGAQLGLSTTLATGGQNLLQQREQTASGVINQNMANYTDPILAMLGINSNTPSAAASMTNTGTGAASSATAGTDITTNDLTSILGSTYSASADMNATNANNAGALCGAGIGAGSKIGGSALGML